MASDDEPRMITTDMSKFSRRRIIEAMATGGVVSVAGCAGGGGEETPSPTEGGGDGDTPTPTEGGGGEETPTPTEGGGKPIDNSFTMAGGGPQVQFNPFNASNQPGGMNLMFDPLARYNQIDDRFEPIFYEDFSVEGTSASVTIPQGRTWTDGKEITADDLIARFTIGKALGEAMWDFTKSVSKTGDYSVEFSLAGEPNRFLFLFPMLETRINAPTQIFQKYVESIKDATTEEATNQALSDLTNFKLTDPVSNGPFKWKQKRGQEFIFQRRKAGTYPNIEKINFDLWNFKGGGSGTEENEALVSAQVDGTMGIFIPPKVAESLPDYMKLIPRQMFTGMMVAINWDNPMWGGMENWRERKALAYAANIKRTAKASNLHGGEKFPQVQPLASWVDELSTWPNTGIDPVNWYSYIKPVVDKYEYYLTNSQDTDKAAQLLRDAGHSKQKGTWTNQQGEPLKVVYKDAAQAQDRVPMGESFLTQWEEFGIKGEHIIEEGSTFWGKSIPQGKFEMATENWNPTSRPHPYFSFFWEFSSPSRANSMDYPDWSKGIEVPWPIGNVNAWDETKKVNPVKKTEEIVAAEPGSDKERRLVQELAWIWNQTALHIMNSTGHWPWILSTDHWNIPSMDHKVWDMPNHPIDFITRPQLDLPTITAKTK